MFEFLIGLSGIILPVFVFLTMFNVGLTQKLEDILKYLSDKGFSLRMLAANFILAPIFMWLMLHYFPIDPYLSVGLIIFSICAGAPFLIKLTQLSEHDMALGASTMITLVLGTILLVPLLLPWIMPEIEINGMKIAWILLKQLLFPIVLGLLLVKVFPRFAEVVQPWVAKVGNWTLYLLLVVTIGGYLPELKKMMGQGAILISIAFIMGAFAIGYILGGHSVKDHLHDVGALGTAQRNTAASMIIAVENFSDHPEVFVVITIASSLGIAMLIGFASVMSKDHKVKVIYPYRHKPQSGN